MNAVISEALRYLGYRGHEPDAATAELLEKGYAELAAAAVPKYCCRLADKNDVPDLLKGEAIKKHLAKSGRVIFFAATLGSAADAVIRRAEITNMAYALVLDALASAMTEEFCDKAENEMKTKFPGSFTWRFSPGYGDYPIELQPDMIRFLNADKLIGLTATESNILIPRKSVTAVIGVSDGEQDKALRGCAVCGMRENCRYRKDGGHCGNNS